jgi:hypothetical protein
MSEVREGFLLVLASANYRIVQLEHRWLDLFLQNYDGRASLLVRENVPQDLHIEEGRGYTVVRESGGESVALRLTSRDVGANAIFVRLVDFLIDKTSQASSKLEALFLLRAAINEFKHFSSRKTGLLSLEQVRGLFAELLVLRALLQSGRSGPSVLAMWKGPHAAEGVGLHDFVFPSGDALEVKSSSHPSSEVRVSSSTQLMPTANDLFLIVIPLETLPGSGGGGLSITQLISECTELMGSGDQLTLEVFFEDLASVGFDPKDDHYTQWHFEESTWKCFQVREGFPYLDIEGIPRAITKIRYSLELQFLREYEVPVPRELFGSPRGSDGNSRA